MVLPKSVSKLFWEIDKSKGTPRKHKVYYVSRILDKGDVKSVSWLFRVFGKDEVKRTVRKSRLSARSLNYWKKFFRLP